MNADEGDVQNKKDVPHEELTQKIIGAAFTVSNGLGCGFLEKVYENSLALELRSMGLDVLQQAPIRVLYQGQTVGDYIADVIVNGAVLVEIKATEENHPVFVAQTLNYLKATGLAVGLVLNFGRPKLFFRRLVRRTD